MRGHRVARTIQTIVSVLFILGQLTPVVEVAHAAWLDAHPTPERLAMRQPSDRPTATADTATESPTPTPAPAPEVGDGTGTPATGETPTETATLSETPTSTATDSPTPTETETPTPTLLPTATEPPTPTPTPDPVTGVSLEAAVSPERVVAGRQATITVTIRNSGSKPVSGLVLRNALADGLVFDDKGGRSAGIGVEAESGDLVAQLDTLAAGGTITLRYRVRAAALANAEAQAITDVLQLNAPGLADPLVAEIMLLVVKRDRDWRRVDRKVDSHLRGNDIVVDIPAEAGVDGLVSVDKETVGAEDQSNGLMVQFDLSMLADEGPQRPSLEQAAQELLKHEDTKEEKDTKKDEDGGQAVSPTSDETNNPTVEPPSEAVASETPAAESTNEPAADEGRAEDPTYEAVATETPVAESTPAHTGAEPVETPTPTPDPDDQGSLSLIPDLSDVLDSTRVLSEETSFEEPVTITISMNGLADLASLPRDRTPFVVVYDEAAGVWVRQPIEKIDYAANALVVKASHFSTWGAGIGGTFPTNGASIPLYDEAKVSTFTGRVSTSFPLWTPSGRGGMSPSLALSYASGAIDGILGDVQSSWVGMGWTLDVAEITRQILNSDSSYGYQDKFVLALNGTSYTLIEDPAHPGQYRSEDEGFLYIQRHNQALGNLKDSSGQEPPNTAKEWWEVVTADGTRYRFGWNADSEQLAPMKGYVGITDRNPVLEKGETGGWDANWVGGPAVLDWGDGTYQMWYSGTDAAGAVRIGSAGGSGGATWKKTAPYDANIIEAEEGRFYAPMSRSGHDQASGCQFVMTPDAGGANNGQGYVDLTFNLATAGDTRFWGRTWSGDFWVQIDGRETYHWVAPSTSNFAWDQVNNTGVADPLVVNLAAGAHTLTIRTNADGSPLDAVVVTQDASYKPPERYCGSGPVLDLGANNAWDDVQVAHPDVLKVGDTYHMWYTGYDGTTYKIGHATSSNGLNWTKDSAGSAVLSPGASGAWDDAHTANPTVLYEDSEYRMWYSGHDGANWRIGYATSGDGVTWTKYGTSPVFGLGSGGAWDATHVAQPAVLHVGGQYLMFYGGYNGSTVRLGLAISTDRTTWTRPTTYLFAPPAWAGGVTYVPEAAYDGSTYRLWFGTSNAIGYATSTGSWEIGGDNWNGTWTPLPNTSTNAWSDLGYAGSANDRVALRWRIDKTRDLYGNTMTYSYAEEQRNVDGLSSQYDTASYLDKILYTGTGGNACAPATEACYEVRFSRANRATGYDLPADADLKKWDTWDKQYLDKVEVYARNSTGDTLLRTYDLELVEINRQDSDGDTTTWDSLQMAGLTTTAPSGAGTLAAPTMRYSYANFDNRAAKTGQAEWAYPRMIEIDNGTSGKATLTYQNDGRPDTEYYNWRITREEVYDGVHSSEKTRTEYTYGTACYNDAARGKVGWCNPEKKGSLVGHPWAVETTKDFDGSVLSTIRHEFYTDETLSGREFQTDTRDATGVIFFRSQTDYAAFDHTNTPTYPVGVKFGYVKETRSYERQGSALALVTRSTSTYDPAWGDVLTESVYDGDGNLFQKVDYTYLTNVDLPETFLHSISRSTLTYDGLNNLIDARYNAYDGTAAGLGTKGALTLEQVRTLTEGQGNQTIDSSYTYDSYGNQVSTRAYAAYGVVGTRPTGNDTLDRTSTTVYDSTYHAFPVTETNALGHSALTTYDFQLTGELPLGLARKVQDPNGAVSETKYDALGRSIEGWQPNATQANSKTIYPTVNAEGRIPAPYTIELQIWDDGGPGGAQYRHAWAFYDGMGRILRTVSPSEDGGKYIQSEIWYNALQQAGKSARPYEVTLSTPPGTWSAPNWASLKVTTSTYDGFGRLVKTTLPDGTFHQSVYDGRLTTAIDPHNHKKVSLQDDFGRLVEIREYTGTGASTEPYQLYATTHYGYNTKGLLNSVIDAQDNQTSITYNTLGQKVYINDPDMGIWHYVYNAWGELVEQTDARGAQVRIEYDKLGRPALRQARIDDVDPWATVSSYTYDTGAYGIGRLAEASSVYVNGSPTVVDAISYDLLGRIPSSTRTVDGVGYTSAATYDSLGRTLTTTLPTGEVLTTTYNAYGVFNSLSGDDTYADDTYVASTSYTPSGGVDQQVLGNGVINDFTYDGVTDRLDRIYAAKPGFLALVDLTYDYDIAGNIAAIDDGVRQEKRSYQYDALDRLTYAGVHAGQQMIEERYYTYDQLGNLLSFRHRYPSAGNGRGVFAVGGSGSADGKASRGSFNGLSSSGMSSGAQGDYSGSALMPYVYGFGGDAPDGGYNGRGSLASGANGEGGAYQGAGSFNPMTGAAESGGYDGRGVTAFVRGIAGGFGGWEGNDYTGPTGETTIDYTYPTNHVMPHAVTARSNGDSFTYDANGNMTQRVQGGATWNQVFDAENKLIWVSDGTVTTTFAYDGVGARFKRTVTDGATTTTTLYIGSLEIEKVDGVETQRTVYYPNGGAFRIIGGEDAGLYFQHGDHLGSVGVMSDATGHKVADSEVAFEPFGDVRAGTLDRLTDIGFTGQRRDESTGGLMFYTSRYYLPGIARFISPDTIIPNTANPQDFNRYSYVMNNPVMYSDPTGHCPMCVTALIGAVAGAAIGALATAGPQMLDNALNNRPLTEGVDGNAVLKAAVVGAVAGGIAGLTMGAGTALIAGSATAQLGFGATVGLSAVSGVTSGMGGRAVEGVWDKKGIGEIAANVFNPVSMAADFVAGGIGGGIGYGVSKAASWAVTKAGGWIGPKLGRAISALGGPKGCNSFSEDTPVETEEGAQEIAEIEVGDYVLAYNEKTGEMGYYPVTHLWANVDPVIVYLVIDGETIETTPEHPFYTADGEWVTAVTLEPADKVVQADGTTGTVETVRLVARTQTMYNFTVDVAHTYFVGEGQWLVHNASCPVRALGTYDKLDGHHLIAKEAFRDPATGNYVPGYDEGRAIVLGKEWLRQGGKNMHYPVSGRQSSLYSRATGDPTSWLPHVRIGVKSLQPLVDAGKITASSARRVVMHAAREIAKTGARPVKFPWK